MSQRRLRALGAFAIFQVRDEVLARNRVDDAELLPLFVPAEFQIQNLAVAHDDARLARVDRDGDELAVHALIASQRSSVETPARRVEHPVLRDGERLVQEILGAHVFVRRAWGRYLHREVYHLPRAPDVVRAVFRHLFLVHAHGDEAVGREARFGIPVPVVDEVVAADHHVVAVAEPRRDSVVDVEEVRLLREGVWQGFYVVRVHRPQVSAVFFSIKRRRRLFLRLDRLDGCSYNHALLPFSAGIPRRAKSRAGRRSPPSRAASPCFAVRPGRP